MNAYTVVESPAIDLYQVVAPDGGSVKNFDCPRKAAAYAAARNTPEQMAHDAERKRLSAAGIAAWYKSLITDPNDWRAMVALDNDLRAAQTRLQEIEPAL